MNVGSIQKKTLIRLVDDDDGLRDALEIMIGYSGWNVKSYADARSFLLADTPSVPGCLVLDYMMPGMNGLEMQRQLLKRGYELPVIFLTGHADVDVAVESFRGGAVDFLKKPVDEDRLLDAIAKAAGDSLMRSLGLPTQKELRKLIAGLAEREKTVLKLMRDGLRVKEISERMGISEHTVYEYRTSIYRKLGTKSLDEIDFGGLLDGLEMIPSVCLKSSKNNDC